MNKKYVITADNLFALVGTLVFLRIPFEFIPHRVYKDKNRPNQYHKSAFLIQSGEGGTLSYIQWSMDNHYGSTFNFEILEELPCE